MIRLRRGLTVRQRQKLREEILERQLTLARKHAAEYGLSIPCRKGLLAYGELATGLHGSCRGEEPPGGGGCLCHCHDDYRGGVESGIAGIS